MSDYSGDPYNPDAYYAAALNYTAPGITDIIGEEQTGTETWMQTLLRIMNTLQLNELQRLQLQVQIQRAQSGLVPYNYSMYPYGGNQSTTVLLIGGVALFAILMSEKGANGGRSRKGK